MCAIGASNDQEQESIRQFRWILDHPNASPWLKEALRTALLRDPIQVLNEVEMLREILRFRSDTVVHRFLQRRCNDTHGHDPAPERRPTTDRQ